MYKLCALDQIGEPRLDSGYIAPGDTKVEFNPLALLLPEELCWIIDTALFYEVSFLCSFF